MAKTVAMMLFLAAAVALATSDTDTIVPEAVAPVEALVETPVENLMETTMTEQTLALPSLIEDFKAKVEKSNTHSDEVLKQAKADLTEANAAKKKSEWDAARYKANTNTLLKTFPANSFPTLVESTFSQCVYKPEGYDKPDEYGYGGKKAEFLKPYESFKAKKTYSTHYRTLCAGEIAIKAEKKEAASKAGELKNKKCADTVEKSEKSAEGTTKSFKKTQVNEGKTKMEAKAVKELQGKLEKAQKEKTKISLPPSPPVTSPELCEKQGFAAEQFAKHKAKLEHAKEVQKKSETAKESAEKAAEAMKAGEYKYKEVKKKSSVEKDTKYEKGFTDGKKYQKKVEPPCEESGKPCTKESEDPACIKHFKDMEESSEYKEELVKTKHQEISTKDEAESHGKEKAKKSAEAVAKTAIYEKKIKKELAMKKGKHDLIMEMEEKASELKAKHPKKPDIQETLEKTKEQWYKSDSTHKEDTAKWAMKLKKKESDTTEMKFKNEHFSKAEKRTKGAESTSKEDCAETSAKQEKGAKEISTKMAEKGSEGKGKVAYVEASEQKTKEKHAKDPFYHLDVYAKKVENMHEVFDKTKAAYERKCKTKEEELSTKSYYKLKSEEHVQEVDQKKTAKKAKEYEAKTEKTTKEKVTKVQSAAENLEKATHERCDKTVADSEKSDKYETKKWSKELETFKANCAAAEKHEEKEQKSFVYNVCQAAHDEMDTIADEMEGDSPKRL